MNWSKREVELLQRYYRRFGKRCKVLFPGRSLSAIKSKAQYQMFRRKPQIDDYKRLLYEYPGRTIEWYADRLNVDVRTAKKYINKISHETK